MSIVYLKFFKKRKKNNSFTQSQFSRAAKINNLNFENNQIRQTYIDIKRERCNNIAKQNIDGFSHKLYSEIPPFKQKHIF